MCHIVNNDSGEIIRMLNDFFDAHAQREAAGVRQLIA